MLSKVSAALPVVAYLLCTGCGVASEEPTETTEAALGTTEVGVLLASHCDIDDLKTELEPYVKSAFLKNDGIPLPDWIRGPLAGPAYGLSYGTVKGQYDDIGPTGYRAKAKLQVDATTAALRAAGINGKAYLGCDFTFPTIPQALEQMRQDGVKKVVVFNKGAQYSIATGGEHMEDAVEYLKENPTWKPETFVMVKEFSSDARFRTLLGDVIEQDVNESFPGVPKEDICILVASHGLPLHLVDKGDRATKQMLEVVDVLKRRFVGYDLRHGFLNDDFFPGSRWTTPKADEVARDMRKDGCTNVYMDSRLSFTTHHRATLYDLDVLARGELEKAAAAATSGSGAVPRKPKVVFGEQFDAEPELAKLYAALTTEALARKNPGNLVDITATAKVPFN